MTRNVNNQTSHLIKTGFDYFINDRNTFSVYSNQNISIRNSDGLKTISFFTNPTLDFQQTDDLNTDNINSTYNIDYKHTFSTNHSIEVEADFNRQNNEVNNGFQFMDNAPVNNYGESIDDDRTNTTINLDYQNPINESSSFELGLETRINRVDNTYETNRIDFSNSNFSFDRYIHSFYTTLSQKWSKWQYNVGVRLESYETENEFIEAEGGASTFSDKQFNIYPSGFLKYTPDESQKHSYVLNYSRRVDRPSLNQINPIRQISTPRKLSSPATPIYYHNLPIHWS